MAKHKKPEDAKHPGGRPSKYPEAEVLRKAIEAYFDSAEPQPILTSGGEPILCKDGTPAMTEKAPSVAGLAYALGYSDRASLYDLKERGEEFSRIIKRAVLKIEAFHEENLALRDKPVGDIFWLKNHGWADKQEIQHSGSVQIIDDIK